jgi:hypothetical protein
MINIKEMHKYFLMVNIISVISLNLHELKKIFKNSESCENEIKFIKKIEGMRDFSKILHDIVTFNLISLLTHMMPKYSLIIRCVRKVKNKIKDIKNNVLHND